MKEEEAIMKEGKRWRTAAIFYSIGGIIFIIVGAIGGRIGDQPPIIVPLLKLELLACRTAV